MTHRVFSRNASSSRAIPVKTMLSQVWNDPAMPEYWGANKSGMQAGGAILGPRKDVIKFVWKTAAKAACVAAWSMMKLGLHKQWANRVLEPWQFIHVIVTATEWDNFMELRYHNDAQPEIFALARAVKIARTVSKPKELKHGEWHLPYITEAERNEYDLKTLQKMSTARCCRVSYLKHDGTKPNVEDDLKLYDRLVGSRPLHASPLEHIATPSRGDNTWSGNLRGWVQYRKQVEKEHGL